MNILVVGGGGREHALVWALARKKHQVFALEANPGFEGLAEVVPGNALDVALSLRPQLVVIGPEAPLAAGLADQLAAQNIAAFGPSQKAAQVESSKIFTKALCMRHHLPTARSKVLGPGENLGDWDQEGRGGVVKMDGLAAGKGVVVAESRAELEQAVADFQRLRPEGSMLIEERLVGPELSLLALCDGVRAIALPGARDHKRRFDGDKGPNTGGMGAVAPVAFAEREACAEILQRAVTAMASEGTPFRGILYGGFMLTPQGPKLLEFNARFGDPECQPLMMLWQDDPADWFLASAQGQLPQESPVFSSDHACCVVVCAQNYPQSTGAVPITALPQNTDTMTVFHAGTRRIENQLYATGGRVLGITACGETPTLARERAYQACQKVAFAGASWRMDIGLGGS